MSRSFVCGLFLIALLLLDHDGCVAHAAQTGIRLDYQSWKDGNRARTIPVKLYLPSQLDTPAPVILFSHGLGGSREAAVYLGKYWAEHGYVCVFIQHPGSDESFWKPMMGSENRPSRDKLLNKFKNTVANPVHAINRANDVHFVLDHLKVINQTNPLLKGKLDLNEVAIAGHSFGSWTALTASGQVMITPAGRQLSSGDSRIKAAIYLSPTTPRRNVNPATVYSGIAIPGLHFTGTLDDSPVSDTKASERRIAFDNITKSDQYLVVLDNADHMVFGGRPRLRAKKTDDAHQEIVARTSTAFLDAYLKRDKQPKQWLLENAKSFIAPHGTLEIKIVGQPSARSSAN